MKFNRQDVVEYLETTLTSKRYQHVLGVEEMALELVEVYGGDKLKTSLTALLHDISKEYSNKWQEETVLKLGYDFKNIEKYSYHALTAPYVYKNIFKFDDPEIDDAIMSHTKFKINASHLAKIIYVADGSERRTREHGFAIETREKIGVVSLDELVLIKIQSSIDHFKESNTHTDFEHLNKLKDFYSNK